MEPETITLRENDIYRWHYREPGDDRYYGRYHHGSQIAVVRNGRLWDTGKSFATDCRSFDTADLPRLELSFLGNLDDLEKAPEYQGNYYDDADIVNLNHARDPTGNFYLRKGANRSLAKMLQSARCQLERAESDERSATRRVESLRETISKIEAGDINAHI